MPKEKVGERARPVTFIEYNSRESQIAGGDRAVWVVACQRRFKESVSSSASWKDIVLL